MLAQTPGPPQAAGGGGGSGITELTAGTGILVGGGSTCITSTCSVGIGSHTGTGLVVFQTSPTLITPVLGVATATSINGLGISTSTGVLTIANGKTLTDSNTLTFTGVDSSSVNFGSGGTVLYGNQTITLTGDTTGSGTTSITTTTSKIDGVSISLGGAFATSAAFSTTGAGVPTLAFGAATATYTYPGATSTLAALGVAQAWTAGQAAAQSTPAISTATFTPNLAIANGFDIVLVHASCPCTIANPTNIATQVGQSGVIEIDQSATGSDTIGTWGSDYKFAGATPPTLSTNANAEDFFGYYVKDATHIIVGAGVLNAQ